MSTATEPFGRRCPNCIGIGIDDTMLGGSSAELEDGRRYVKFDFKEAWYRVFPLADSIKDSFPTLPVLSASSEDGCTFCAFLKDLFTSGEVFYLFEDIMQGFTERDGLSFDLKLEFQWRFSVESADLDFSQLKYLVIMVILDKTTQVWHDNTHWRNPIQIHCSVQLLPGEDHRNDNVATWLQLKSASVPDLLSPETIAGIKLQLSSCYHGIGEHEGVCVTNEPSYFVPTRLIDVRQADLRILSGESISQQSREAGICPSYTALSYCWGKISDVEAEYQTTSQNLEARQTRLEANLPPVLRDAVAVTRALSIPYLWVDAICILQDQLGDWETESARLDKVYAAAYVTIVCLTSSCQLGFLQPQKPRTNMAFRSRIDPTISGGYRIEFANCYWHSLPRKGYNDLLPSSRWFSRGWTYQEAWLSSRALFVGLDFMGISCAAGLFAEGQWTQQGGLQNAMTQTRASDDLGQSWLKTAFYYLDRYLSVPGDALPALSGVAGVFAASMGDDYLAGVWGSDIVRGVLWGYAMSLQSKPPTLENLLGSLHDSESYIAPSWSWAGRRGISFRMMWQYNNRIKSLCDATGSTTVIGHNKFGRVLEGHLFLTGHTWHIGPSTVLKPGVMGKCVSLGANLHVECVFDWVARPFILLGDFKLILLASLHIMPWNEEEGDHLLAPTSHGLILHKSISMEDYVRVGMFESFKDDGGVKAFFLQQGIETVRVV